jgi:hypothetical protein
MRMRRIGLSLFGAIFMSSALFPLRAGQDSGLDLIHKMQRALGGADKIAAIRDLDWTVRADTFDREGKPIGQVTKRTRWIKPNYLRLDQVGPGDTYVLYFDGRSGWEILPGTTSVIELAGGELEFARGYLSGFMLNLWVADGSSDSTITSPGPNVIRISSKTNTNDIILNRQTWLPAQIAEWMNVDGVQFPARELNSHKDDGSADIRTEKVEFNVGLTPGEMAAKPPDGKPVLVNH